MICVARIKSSFLLSVILALSVILLIFAGCTNCGEEDDDDEQSEANDDQDDDQTTDDDAADDDQADDDQVDDDAADDDQGPPDHLQNLPLPGIEAVTNIESLPLLRLNSRARQFSSHDLAGGNNDGFQRGTHFYKDDQGDFVIFDDFGPGCIYRMWFTGPTEWLGHIKIYVDDMETPVIDRPFVSFFAGWEDPFLFPFTYFIHQSSGGFLCYIPICYRQRAKVTLSVKPEFFHISYRHYDADQEVTSFTGQEDVSRLTSQWATENLGQDPKEARSTTSETVEIDLASGDTQALWTHGGSGAVWSLYLDVSPRDQEVVENLWLRAYWDEMSAPMVDVPLHLFFGAEKVQQAPLALPVGHDGERYYCHLPMPFWSFARLELANLGTTAVQVKAEIVKLDESYPFGSAGYFSAVYRREENTTEGTDYTMADVAGAGHLVGVTHTMESWTGPGYMEGDERIHTDGSGSPAIYGTGTEDFYSGGWYFLFGPFARPLHGATTYISEPGYDLSCCYRFLLGDIIPFADGLHFGIEHDLGNISGGDDYRNVAYLYKHPLAGASETDVLEIDDLASETQHEYQTDNAVPTGEVTSFYEGDHDDVEITDFGDAIRGSCSFRMEIDPDNRGVLLRRRLEQYNGRQQAEVYVDDQFAGTWYDLVSNQDKRWADSDMLLPASLTAGKASIQIRLDNAGDTPWTQFRFQVLSLLPPAEQ